jgi:type IV pilus assembly protein PilQ
MIRVRPIIEALDRATDQVMIESKFVEVTNSDVKNIGLNWSSLANYRVGVGGMTSSLTRDRGQTGTSTADGSSGTTRTGITGTNALTGTNNASTQHGFGFL